MNFVDTAFNKTNRYSIGREAETGLYYLSIPVTNQLADYEEYYEISAEMHNSYPANSLLLDEFADRCRKRLNDALLIQQPGQSRGVAT